MCLGAQVALCTEPAGCYTRQVVEAADAAKSALTAAAASPAALIPDVLHRAAFDGGLGAPLLLDPASVTAVTNAHLRDFVTARMRGGRAVLTAAGECPACLLIWLAFVAQDVCAET